MNNSDDQLNHVKGVIEALLFVNERPVTLEQIKKVLKTVSAGDIKKAFKSLQDDYSGRKSGINFVEIAEGYQMLSNPTFAQYVREFYKSKHKEKLSKPALETLAIIAYKQPVTRGEIELIRGVNSDGVVMHLVEKELIKIVGRKDVAGRPFLYGTTKQFMEYFGLKNLDDLPALEELVEYEEKQRAKQDAEGPAEEAAAGAEGSSAETEKEGAQAQETEQATATATLEQEETEEGQEEDEPKGSS